MKMMTNTTAEYLNFILYLRAGSAPSAMLSALLGAFQYISSIGFASFSIDAYIDSERAKSRSVFAARTELTSLATRRALADQNDNVHRFYAHIARRNSDDILRDFKLAIQFDDSEAHLPENPAEDNLGNPCDHSLLLPTLRISLRIDTLFSDTPANRAKFVDEIVRAVARTATIRSGFVTCEPAERTCAGSLYVPPFGEELPMDLIIRELAWWRLVKTGRPLVRGVYWGNIWGPEIVEQVKRINLLDSISEWKVEHLTKGTMMPGGASVEPLADGSVFVKLSPDPLDSSETWRQHGGKKFIGLFDSLASIRCSFAAWIHLQLRSLDLLL